MQGKEQLHMNLPWLVIRFQMKLTVQKQLNKQIMNEIVFSGHGYTDETDSGSKGKEKNNYT